MNWYIVLETVGVVGGIATWLALMLGPMFYLGSKIEKLRDKMDEEAHLRIKEKERSLQILKD